MVETLERPAFHLTLALVNDPFAAEDILQEAFLRVWRSRRTPSEHRAFRLWLYRTILNLARDYHRRQTVRNRVFFWQPIAPTDPVALSERYEENAALAAALRTLSMRERQAIYLRFSEDAPYDDIGKAIGLRDSAARVVIHRALRKLRDRLVESGSQPEVA
jgi:RNA polymerase sigma-70 factor (ECF subfamily)